MPETILLIDDDESLLELCKVGLRRAGYDVTTCETGEAALKLLEGRGFDIVLTDLQLPGKTDGQGVVRAVKARHPSSEVVLMTAVPTLQSAIQTLKDGACDYLLKPFHVDQLEAVVKRALDYRRLRQDLAQEKALRQELESTYAELQKVERLKESFLARVSHEIKTPLTSLQMAVELMGETLGKSPDTAGLSKHLGHVRAGAARLDRTLSDLLAFVDAQEKPRVEKASPVDLQRLCRDAVAKLKPLLEPRRISVGWSFEEGFPAVPGDPALLAKAFEHLVRNAIVFNKEGGSIRIQGRSRSSVVEVSVSDTGEGIPEAEFDKIFDSFYQIAVYLTRKVDGLGLGLAIARRAVEAHGGEISVSSKPGEGTTFTVRFPLGSGAAGLPH